jgi:hypothetical protein
MVLNGGNGNLRDENTWGFVIKWWLDDLFVYSKDVHCDKKNNDQGVAWHLHTSSNKVPNEVEMDSPLWLIAID